ncbi:MAG: hypothetical protein K2Y22_13115 [Candidatus Obscuribacterales bacterium]|nr:hypothetical protein [Candidatus Obscuribacterales bacterium]
MLLAVDLAIQLVCEIQSGGQLYIQNEKKAEPVRLLLPGIGKPATNKWKYLVEIPHAWKRQLFVKGRRLPAASIWTRSLVNKLMRQEAADNWDLPLEAIEEIMEYCDANKEFLQMEADEERRLLLLEGIKVELQTSP